MKHILSITSLTLLLFGCASDGEGYTQKNDLLVQIQQGKKPVIVDVRSSMEYKSGHIPNAIHIPFWTAFTTGKLAIYDKATPIILYCEHGPRAGIAKLALSLSGFEKISYLDGHMTAWRQSGLPIEKTPETK
ncbi:MAG: rhodanese-like domain-containing protein [Methylococcales bacterium]|nr:rhodanese-like domain-containing protein [Methylococcales bacterium]